MKDEILDLVSQNDDVIGQVSRNNYDQLLEDNSGYIRASELFILNDEGKIWVPVRTSTKKIAPNGYDYSAAGHVETGEDYVSTIIRETQEEINLNIPPDQLEFVAKLKSVNTRYMRSIYLYRTNEAPNFNPADFVGAQWLTPVELIESIDQGHPTKSSLRDSTVVLQMYLTNS